MLKLISRTSTHNNWFETWVSPFDLQVIQPQLIEDFFICKMRSLILWCREMERRLSKNRDEGVWDSMFATNDSSTYKCIIGSEFCLIHRPLYPVCPSLFCMCNLGKEKAWNWNSLYESGALSGMSNRNPTENS